MLKWFIFLACLVLPFVSSICSAEESRVLRSDGSVVFSFDESMQLVLGPDGEWFIQYHPGTAQGSEDFDNSLLNEDSLWHTGRLGLPGNERSTHLRINGSGYALIWSPHADRHGRTLQEQDVLILHR